MELTPRLRLALTLCAGGRSLIDVGCDHAYLCLAAVQSGFEHAFASDLREGPLAAAKEHIALAGASASVQAVLCPGLEGFSPEDGDTVSICGMGGELIASILEQAPWTKDGAHTLVLQPMTCADRLRRWLADNGYAILQERLAAEGDKLYLAMQVRGGTDDCGRDNFYLFTEKLKDDPLFPLFLERETARVEKAAAGKRLAGLDTAAEEAVLYRLKEVRHGA